VEFHIESGGSFPHHLSDPAHADDAETLAGDLMSDHERWTPAIPLAIAYHGIAFYGASSGA